MPEPTRFPATTGHVMHGATFHKGDPEPRRNALPVVIEPGETFDESLDAGSVIICTALCKNFYGDAAEHSHVVALYDSCKVLFVESNLLGQVVPNCVLDLR